MIAVFRGPFISLYCLLLSGLYINIQAQTTILSGIVRDAETKETLIGAAVTLNDKLETGCVTNENGFFSLTIPYGKYQLKVRYLGYLTETINLNIVGNKQIEIMLKSDQRELKEIQFADSVHTRQQHILGAETIQLTQMDKLPLLFGERDYIRSIQLLPGVQTSGEGQSGFFVRGGSADQNLVLLDDGVVYSPSHLLGFFSSFNPHAIGEFTLFKGNAPAWYGGRISSILDIRMIDGDKQRYHLGGNIGLIAAGIYSEGPIVKNKVSYLFSARRTFVDLLTRLSSKKEIKESDLYFYDFNARILIKPSQRTQLSFSGFFSQDHLSLSDLKLVWHNALATTRFQYLINKNLSTNTSFAFSQYQSKVTIMSDDSIGIGILSRITDFSLKQEFHITPNTHHNIRVGLQTTYHLVTPGNTEGSGISGRSMKAMTVRHSCENALYASADWSVRAWLKIHYGLRLVSFHALGPGNYYSFQNNNIDSVYYDTWQIAKSYFNAEPRVFFHFIPLENLSIKAGYARHTQFIHTVANHTASNPTDKWVSSSNNIRPQIADQVSLAFTYSILNKMFEFSIEGYYKNLQNQIDFKDGADIINNEYYENDLLSGNGRSYGLEFSIKKDKGALTGWVAYTLSRSERKIDGINTNNWYPARQDRTHDLNIVLSYQIKRWRFSGIFVYATGNAITYPSGKYLIDNKVVYLYTDRNGHRMPDYHRLDLSVTVDIRRKDDKLNSKGKPIWRWIISEISFGAYNVYNRYNTFRISFQQNKDNLDKTEAVNTALFGIVPYVSYHFKF
ncbi:MAG: TonB-dependent receptor [Flavobacteriales bacterium]|nr:TonB-dependent receptor [Flavobacteriales bacterium]